MRIELEAKLSRHRASPIEVQLPSGQGYRQPPDRACLSVPVLGVCRHKPAGEPEEWCDELPAASRPVGLPLSAFEAVFGILLMVGLVLLAGYGFTCLLRDGLYAVLYFFLATAWPFALLLVMLWVVARVAPRVASAKYSVLELDSDGVRLSSEGASAAWFAPYASIRGIRTYLDEGVGGGAWRGIIVDIDGGRSFTLELGENTGKVADAMGHHTHLVPRHSRSTWVEAVGC